MALLGVAALAGALSASSASARAIDPSATFNPNNTLADSFDRGGNVSVRQRPRPDYQAAGLHVGGFMIYPTITRSVGYDDHICALQSHTVGETIFAVAPEIDVQSTWSRNAIAADVRMSQDWCVTHTTEDATQDGAGMEGKFEFGESTVTAAALRAAGNSGIINSAGYLTAVGGFQVDHERLRNVILTGNASIGHDQYHCISRNDDHRGAGISANWLVTRRLRLTVAYGYSNQRSSGAQFGPSFSDNRVSGRRLCNYKVGTGRHST